MAKQMETSPTPSSQDRALVVGLILPDTSRPVAQEHLAELGKLVEAAGAVVVGQLLQERKSPDAATYIGKGKAEQLAATARESRATIIVFDDDLSPAQVRNVESLAGVAVIDRSGLILDIFARRARSRESRTQVELAQLNYLLPRLRRQWTHLSRQAGGIGTRGVGETQLELDRRIIRERIAKLKDELAHIEQTRETQRRSRASTFAVALVGYTNAGKSTLFNRLTEGSAEAVDKLFATLDAKTQKSRFEFPSETVFIDTVGFIRKLPHHLVASFRSTMEEAVSADLVLHVIDMSHPQVDEQRDVGRAVLEELGITQDRVIDVYNKIDQPADYRLVDDHDSVTLSALTGRGVGALLDQIRSRQLSAGEVVHLVIPARESKLAANLHELGEVRERVDREDGIHIVAWVPRESLHLVEPFVSQETDQHAAAS